MMRTMPILGGPRDGETIDVADGPHVVQLLPARQPATIRGDDVVAPAPDTYVVRRLAMFGREFDVLVWDRLTEAQADDAAWDRFITDEVHRLPYRLRPPDLGRRLIEGMLP